MYPGVLMLNQEAGHIMMNARRRALGAAKDHAWETGFFGARFPWESGYIGEGKFHTHVFTT
jgi:trehalose/maltose hydrolase-like predicted phosphorylase